MVIQHRIHYDLLNRIHDLAILSYTPWFSEGALLLTKSEPLSAMHVALLGEVICRPWRGWGDPDLSPSVLATAELMMEQKGDGSGMAGIFVFRVSRVGTVSLPRSNHPGRTSTLAECLSSRGCVIGFPVQGWSGEYTGGRSLRHCAVSAARGCSRETTHGDPHGKFRVDKMISSVLLFSFFLKKDM